MVGAMEKKRLLVIAGPTAVGKSDLALRLAERLAGEIVSADSAQVYRGLDIGTAKPTATERARVRHHLIDVRDPRQPFTVAEYQTLARAAIADIQARGRLPLLVGGTGLYIRAVLRPFHFAGAPPDPALRAALEREEPMALYARLRALDPVAADRIDPRNVRRTIRALEVCLTTGRPFSAGWREEPPLAAGVTYIALDRAREELYRRIADRVHDQLRDGLVAEVAALLESGVPRQAQSMQALGYKEVAAHLAGELTLAEMIDLLIRRTRQYARRQLTWLRREPVQRWLHPDEAFAAILQIQDG
jgi:tRNA dimethylallyltransferase